MTSPPDKRDPTRGWRWVEGVIDEEADRLATASDGEAERELARLPPPPRVPTAADLLGRARDRAGPRPASASSNAEGPSARPSPRPAVADRPAAEPARRRWRAVRWAPWLVAATIGVLVVLVVRRHEVEPGEGQAPPPAAAELRRTALHDCERGAWQACLRGLDAARAKDAAGDRTPEVRDARAKAESALRGP